MEYEYHAVLRFACKTRDTNDIMTLIWAQSFVSKICYLSETRPRRHVSIHYGLER